LRVNVPDAVSRLHVDLGADLFPSSRSVLQVPLFAHVEFGSLNRRLLLRMRLRRQNVATKIAPTESTESERSSLAHRPDQPIGDCDIGFLRYFHDSSRSLDHSTLSKT